MFTFCSCVVSYLVLLFLGVVCYPGLLLVDVDCSLVLLFVLYVMLHYFFWSCMLCYNSLQVLYLILYFCLLVYVVLYFFFVGVVCYLVLLFADVVLYFFLLPLLVILHSCFLV